MFVFFYFVRQSFEESFFFQLAFPDHNQIPAEPFQLFFCITVSVDIGFEFLLPEFNICGWGRRMTTSRMPMPETATHLDERAALRNHDVGMPDNAPVADAKAVAVRP